LSATQLSFFLTSLVCLVFWVQAGCKQHQPKALPAPLLDNVEYELEGRVRRIWSSDSFEFGEVNELHYIMIRGVDTPKPGQPYFDEAKEHLTKLVRHRITRISVVGRDAMMREFADVHTRPKPVGGAGKTADAKTTADAGKSADEIEINVGLSLIQQGFGWYDGMDFEGADTLKQAEQKAREERIGLWAQDNPTPPWEFKEQ